MCPETHGYKLSAPLGLIEDQSVINEAEPILADQESVSLPQQEEIQELVDITKAEELINQLHQQQLAIVKDMNANQLKIFIKAQSQQLAQLQKGTTNYTSFLWLNKKKTGKKIGVQVHSIGRRTKKDGSRTKRPVGRPKLSRASLSQKIR